MRRSARSTWVVVASLLVGLWLLPSIVARSVLPRFLPNPDLVLVLEGVRPTFPLGIRVKTITLQHPHWTLEAVDSRLVWLVVRFWGETRIAGGALQSRGTGLGGAGIVRLDGVQLRELPLEALAGFEMRGRADGVIHWGDRTRGNLWIADGELRNVKQVGLGLPFSLLVLEGDQRPDSAWRLTTIQLHDTALTLDGTGTVGGHGELALKLTIRALDEPVRSTLEAVGLRVGPLPRKLFVEGTVRSPRFR